MITAIVYFMSYRDVIVAAAMLVGIFVYLLATFILWIQNKILAWKNGRSNTTANHFHGMK